MNGTGLINTLTAARRQNISFPNLPDVNTMLNLGYTSRPTFFG